jgi:uncharacterized circularly permuted ATP-grasp superfamily protein
MFSDYLIEEGLLDEVFESPSKVNGNYANLVNYFNAMTPNDYKVLNDYAKKSFLSQGITFVTYQQNNKGTERIFPFDLLPRLIRKTEWDILEKGLIQRNMAINLFLFDLYHKKHILHDKIVPTDLIASCGNYNKQMFELNPYGAIYNHISGTDLIKHSDGKFYVLEDNVRCPSGVSYVLANREAMKRTLSPLFSQFTISGINTYTSELLETIKSVCPESVDNPVCAILTPGMYNSAYYEHSYLAQSMGIELIEGNDLYVEDDFVYMQTVYGPKRVDVIYRRVDDDYLDPMVFNPNSLLGVPGIMGAFRKGNVTIINAPGTGVADDKAVYAYVPEIIKYYLKEEPILSNVPTYRCDVENDFKYVVENISKLVVKPVDQSGGYGVMIGTKASQKELEDEKLKIKSNPRGYIAQPVMSLSMHSTYIEEEQKFEPRHIDLRTFTLLGKNRSFVLKGGLSRVALKKGSLIVNSSQGGGSKDSWVVEE